MIKISFLFFFAICFYSNSFFAQNIDSLIQKLESSKEDTNKVFLYKKIANYYVLRGGATEKAQKYLEAQLALSQKINFKKGEYYALMSLGNNSNNSGSFEVGIEYLEKALIALKESNPNDHINIAVIYASIANSYSQMENLIKGMEYYLKALQIMDQANADNLSVRTKIYSNLAIVFEKDKQFEKAVEYSLKSIDIAKSKKDTLGMAGAYSNLANTYCKMKKFNKSIDCHEKALVYSKITNRITAIASNLIGLGIVYQDLNKYNKALEYHLRAYDFSKKNKMLQQQATSLSNIGYDYTELKEYDKAITYLNQSLELSKKMNLQDVTQSNYQCLSKCYEGQNDLSKSLEALKNQYQVKDSMFNEKKAIIVSDLATKYETAIKQKKISELNAKIKAKQKDKTILEGKIQKRNAIISGTIIGFILLVITLILFFNRRRLLQQNLHQKAINEQRELTTTEIVQALEKEQSRIAKDLHDSIGTFLSTLKINLQLYEEEVPKDKQENYQKTLNLIDKISFELRNIMKNLSHDTLQDHGLGKAMEEFVSRLNDLHVTSLKCYISDFSPAVTDHIQHNIYRISQELLTNCIKHAQAKEASIQIIEEDNIITLMYEDNGIGILPGIIDNRNSSQSMGLKNIYNRVEFIKGNIQIDSNPKSGTTIIIEIPLKKK
ncbi:MAG: sensor histidine kinase [Flavobacteriia bacterium]|nr:sensor histidine kinase [Flavobacteriia bacterium]